MTESKEEVASEMVQVTSDADAIETLRSITMTESKDQAASDMVQVASNDDAIETIVFEMQSTEEVMPNKDSSQESQPRIIILQQADADIHETKGDPQLDSSECEQTTVEDADQSSNAQSNNNSSVALSTVGDAQLVDQDSPKDEVNTVKLHVQLTEGISSPAKDESSDITDLQALVGTKPSIPQLVFKCVPVSSDGTPDTSKTLKLNRDILKEVLEKHGFSMDPKDWPEEALEEEEASASRKRKKKAKKMKRKRAKLDQAKEIKEKARCKVCARQFFDIGHLKIHEKVHLDENEAPLECSLCNMVFKREVGLKYHIQKVHNKDFNVQDDNNIEEEEGDFKCDEEGCTRSFKTSKGLTQHTNQGHKGIGKIKSIKSLAEEDNSDLKCEKCDKTFATPSKLTMHMIGHSNLNLKCTDCDIVCKNHNLLRRHYSQVHQDVKPCSLCGKRSKKARHIPCIVDSTVGDVGEKVMQRVCYRCFKAKNEKKQVADAEDKEEFIKCPICTLMYYGFRGLKHHLKRSHPEENLEVIKNEEEEEEIIGDYPCVEEGCLRIFTTKRGLGLHMISQHIKDPKYTCEKEGCNRTFITKSGLSSHMKRHNTPAVFKCDQCTKMYDANYKLTEHMKIHKDPIIECQLCDKKLRLKGLICQHQTDHTGNAFGCPECGKQFKRAEYVRRHQLQVHDSNSKIALARKLKRKICKICQHPCTTNAELRDHMNSHTGDKPHLCEICPKTFACKASLFVHRQAHKQAYRCEYCKKVFGDRTRMKEHLVVHTGEKPFVCQQCGRTFGHRSNLREHLKRIHKKGNFPLAIRKASPRATPNTVVIETEAEPQEGQQPPQQQISYEILTTNEAGHIIEGGGQVIPVRLNTQGDMTGATIQVFQQQEGIDGSIQLQDVTGNTFVKTIQGPDGQIHLQNPEHALAAEIVLQLHSDSTYAIQ